MLDAFCSKLSDEAQLKIAIRLGRMAMPVWNIHFDRHAEAADQLNQLIKDETRIQGAVREIDPDFPQRCIEKIERSLIEAKEKSPGSPVPLMKGDAKLSPMLATIMQPLTNKQWDNTFTQSVRLVYTMVFNMLVWILLRRRTQANETHIYVAINQAADVLLRENIATVDQLNEILDEYKGSIRGKNEETDWENAFGVGREAPMQTEDIYRRIIGENVDINKCGQNMANEVLRQMREEGRSYWNSMDEYLTGTSTTYSYNVEKQTFLRQEIDVIVESFSNQIEMSEGEMRDFIAGQLLSDLRDSGFEV